MADGFELGTDEWFATYLVTRLSDDFERLEKCYTYREGTNALPGWGTGQSLSQYDQIIDLSRLNFAWQIVSAHVSRKELRGIQTADSTAEGDEVADALVFGSALELQFSDAMLSKATYGRGYLTVVSDEAGDGPERVSVVASDAWQTYAMPDDIRPWLTRAAVTIGWNPVTSEDFVTLYMAGADGKDGYSVRWVAFRENGESAFPSRDQPLPITLTLDDGSWMKEAAVPSPGGQRCQVVQFSTETGKGEFERHYATLDRINHTILQRVVITVMQAFKQRAVSGKFPQHFPEGHPRAGEEIDYDALFEAGPDALWFIPEDAKMWESDAVDIRPILEAIQDDLKHLASAASIPMYVLSPDAANGSAEGANAARETQSLKTRRDEKRDKRSLAALMHVAFLGAGDESRAVEPGIVAEFENSALVSELDKANVSKQLRDSGFSHEFIARRVFGLTAVQVREEQIARRREESFAVVTDGG